MSFVIKLIKCTVQRMFKTCRCFSDIRFRAFAIAEALSETIAANFFDPTADIT